MCASVSGVGPLRNRHRATPAGQLHTSVATQGSWMVPLCWSSAIRANARIPRLSPTRTRGRRCKSAARHWSTPIDSAHSMVIHNTGVLNGPDVLAVNPVAPFVLTAIMRKPRWLIYPTRWTCRLRRWPPRRRRSPRGAVLLRRPPAPGPSAGAPVPARTDRPDLDPPDRPGKVFDLELPLDRAAEGDTAMDERKAIKVLLRP